MKALSLSLLCLFAFGVAGVRAHQLLAPVSPCHEDEALVWVDAPNTAACVPLDNLSTSR